MELSNFSRQLKLKPGIDDDHRVIVAMSNNLWFRGMDIKEEGEGRKNPRIPELEGDGFENQTRS